MYSSSSFVSSHKKSYPVPSADTPACGPKRPLHVITDTAPRTHNPRASIAPSSRITEDETSRFTPTPVSVLHPAVSKCRTLSQPPSRPCASL
jgi:hypothetical protein